MSEQTQENGFALGLEMGLLLQSISNELEFYESEIKTYEALIAITEDESYRDSLIRFKSKKKRMLSSLKALNSEIKGRKNEQR